MCLACLAFSFRYADSANLNKGVIVSLLTSAVVYTAVLFYFLYGERVTLKESVGMVLICFSVYCVGYEDDKAGLEIN